MVTIDYVDKIEEKITKPAKEGKMPRHKYFQENPDKIRCSDEKDGYYNGQTEKDSDALAPRPIVLPSQKTDRTKSTTYNSTKVLEERRMIRESKRRLKQSGVILDNDADYMFDYDDDNTSQYERDRMDTMRSFFQTK